MDYLLAGIYTISFFIAALIIMWLIATFPWFGPSIGIFIIVGFVFLVMLSIVKG